MTTPPLAFDVPHCPPHHWLVTGIGSRQEQACLKCAKEEKVPDYPWQTILTQTPAHRENSQKARKDGRATEKQRVFNLKGAQGL